MLIFSILQKWYDFQLSIWPLLNKMCVKLLLIACANILLQLQIDLNFNKGQHKGFQALQSKYRLVFNYIFAI